MNKKLIFSLKNLITGIFLLSLTGCANHITEDSFNYSAGILYSSNNDVIVKKATLDIPIITKDMDPNYGFGVIITSTSGQAFSGSMMLTMPKTDTVSVSGAKNYTVGNKTVISSPEKIYEKGRFFMFSRFDKDDPEGEYSVDILLDNKIKKTIKFNVFYPENFERESNGLE